LKIFSCYVLLSILLLSCKANIRYLKSKNYLKFKYWKIHFDMRFVTHRILQFYGDFTRSYRIRVGRYYITRHLSQKDIIMSRIKFWLRFLGVAISPRVSTERAELNRVSSLQYRHDFRTESCGHPRDCGRYPGPRGSVDCPNSRDSANNGDRATRGVNSALNYTGGSRVWPTSRRISGPQRSGRSVNLCVGLARARARCQTTQPRQEARAREED